MVSHELTITQMGNTQGTGSSHHHGLPLHWKGGRFDVTVYDILAPRPSDIFIVLSLNQSGAVSHFRVIVVGLCVGDGRGPPPGCSRSHSLGHVRW